MNHQCITETLLDQSDLADFESFINYINGHQAINYFLCFSSLFYTIKFDSYNAYSTVYNGSEFNRLNRFYKEKNKEKCIETEYDCDRLSSVFSWDSLENAYVANIHICLLNDQTYDVCHLLTSEYNKHSNKQLKCIYNVWNGEYEFRFGNNIKLIIHEYETTLKTSARMSFWSLQSWWTYAGNVKYLHNNMDISNINEEASMKRGLMEYLTAHEYFEVPLYFFYNENNRRNKKFNYLNYLGAPIRLPSDIIDFLMKFYTQIWYK